MKKLTFSLPWFQTFALTLCTVVMAITTMWIVVMTGYTPLTFLAVPMLTLAAVSSWWIESWDKLGTIQLVCLVIMLSADKFR